MILQQNSYIFCNNNRQLCIFKLAGHQRKVDASGEFLRRGRGFDQCPACYFNQLDPCRVSSQTVLKDLHSKWSIH